MSKRKEERFEDVDGDMFGEPVSTTKSKTKQQQGKITHTIVDPSDLDNTELFAYVMAVCESKQEFERTLSVMSYVANLRLAAHIQKANADSDKYYAMVLEYSDVSQDERLEALDKLIGVVKVNRVDGISKVLWDVGRGAVNCGFSPTKFLTASKCGSIVSELMEDVTSLVKDVHARKVKYLDNAIKCVIATFPARQKKTLTTPAARYKAVMNLIESFNDGTITQAMASETYSGPNEAGVTLPHTLDSKEWIGASVARFMNSQYRDSVVSFNTDDMQEVRSYNGLDSEYLFLSANPVSPFFQNNSPSIFVPGDDDPWLWRAAVLKSQGVVSLEVETQPQLSAHRETMLRAQLFDEATAFARNSATDVEIVPTATNAVSKVVGDLYAKKFVFHFFKRSYSTKAEVEEHQNYLHVVKDTIANEVSKDEFFLVGLGDSQSVILIPHELWAKSLYSRNSTGAFYTEYGYAYSTMFDSFKLLFALYRLSHVKNMFDSWDGSTSYDFKTHDTVLKRITSFSGSVYTKLFAGMSVEKRDSLMSYASVITRTSLMGLWIAPGVSKTGKNTVKEIAKVSGFDKTIYSFNESMVLKSFNDNSSVTFDDYPVKKPAPKTSNSESAKNPPVEDVNSFDESVPREE